MYPNALAGVVVVSIAASAAMAETRGQWQPVDCTSVEAKSLEAELLDCDPPMVGAEASGEPSPAVEMEEEATPSWGTLVTSTSSTSLDLASIGTQADW